MNKIFLSHRFDDGDAPLVALIERVIRSHGTEPVTGRRLGGEALRPEIQSRIKECAGLVALCTRDPDEDLAAGGWRPSRWVAQELQYAREIGRPAIAIVEQDPEGGEGVQLTGMYEDHEHLELYRESPLGALLSLSETLGNWNRLPIRVQIQSPELLELAADPTLELGAEYRLATGGVYTEWSPVELIPEDEGIFAYIRVASAWQGIQITFRHDGELYSSAVTPQRVRVRLNRVPRQR